MATLNSTPLRTSSSLFSLPSRSFYIIPSPSTRLYLKNPIFPSLSTSLKPSKKLNPRTALTITSAHKKLSEAELIELPNDLEQIVRMFPEEAGVYAVHDKNNDVQFIGITRNIAASAITHRKSQPELCWSIKAGVVDDPDRTTLTEAWKSWMEEHISIAGKVPPGNESGNATWVQQQQKRKKADLRLTPGPNVQLTVPLEQLIDRLVKENKVVAFIKGSRSAPLCGFSQRVIGILESSGIDYESIDVLDEQYNRGLRETLKTYSNWPTFPQIFVNGELVGGCDILSSMHENGELASLFRK